MVSFWFPFETHPKWGSIKKGLFYLQRARLRYHDGKHPTTKYVEEPGVHPKGVMFVAGRVGRSLLFRLKTGHLQPALQGRKLQGSFKGFLGEVGFVPCYQKVGLRTAPLRKPQGVTFTWEWQPWLSGGTSSLCTYMVFTRALSGNPTRRIEAISFLRISSPFCFFAFFGFPLFFTHQANKVFFCCGPIFPA